MGNLVEVSPRAVTVTLDGVVDMDLAEEGFPYGLRVSGIHFWPSGAGDTIAVRSKTATGQIIYKRKDVDGQGVFDSFEVGKKLKPYIKASDVSLVVPANARVVFYFS